MRWAVADSTLRLHESLDSGLLVPKARFQALEELLEKGCSDVCKGRPLHAVSRKKPK